MLRGGFLLAMKIVTAILCQDVRKVRSGSFPTAGAH